MLQVGEKGYYCWAELGKRVDHLGGCPFGGIDDLGITILPLQHEGLQPRGMGAFTFRVFNGTNQVCLVGFGHFNVYCFGIQAPCALHGVQ